MAEVKVLKKQRQRAPSQRSLETKKRILDSAERLFAERGFEGASIRDIAREADVPGALVNHHGGSKEQLFFAVVERRAEELSQARLDALAAAQASGDLSLRAILACFILPFFDRFLHGGAAWSAYGRLIAHVSSDRRWQNIAATCFDPTVRVFLDAMSEALPGVSRQALSASFVFLVSSMLSICTSRWRIEGLSEDGGAEELTEVLLNFCEAGFKASLSKSP